MLILPSVMSIDSSSYHPLPYVIHIYIYFLLWVYVQWGRPPHTPNWDAPYTLWCKVSFSSSIVLPELQRLSLAFGPINKPSIWFSLWIRYGVDLHPYLEFEFVMGSLLIHLWTSIWSSSRCLYIRTAIWGCFIQGSESQLSTFFRPKAISFPRRH